MHLFHYFAEWYRVYGYPCLFFCVLLENTGLPVPGETAVLAAGFLASAAGGSRLSLQWIIPIAFAAAVMGDNLGYLLGARVARPLLQRRKGFLLLTPARLAQIEHYFQRFGVMTVAFARFIAGARTVCALSAGAAAMPWRKFFIVDVCAALAWAIVVSLLGYFVAGTFHGLHRWLGWGAWIVLAVVVAVAAIIHWHAVRTAGKRSG